MSNTKGKPVAVVVGATSKWQSDGRNTKLAHGKTLDDSHLPVGVRFGIGGAVAQKFAQEGFFTVLYDAGGGERDRPCGGDPGPGRRLHGRLSWTCRRRNPYPRLLQ